MNNQKDIPTFKIVLAGSGGVGKSTFIKKFRTDTFEPKYIASIGIDITTTIINTNKGPICFNFWDSPYYTFYQLRDGFYFGADAAIIMFDLSARNTYKDIPHFYKDIVRVCNDIPVVLCGNKVELAESEIKVKENQIRFQMKNNIQYYSISVKTNTNIQESLLDIARKLMDDADLYFIMADEDDIKIEEKDEKVKNQLY